MKDNSDLTPENVQKRLAELQPVIAKAVAGDFSKDLKIPPKHDEFRELFIGIQKMVTVMRDQVQELKDLTHSLEAKAAERSAALEEAQALTHLGSWQWDILTGAISWSDELYRIYGLRPQERKIGYEEFLDLIHPADRQRISDTIGASFKAGTPFEFEHRIILPNKQLRMLFGMGKVIKNSAGEPIKMVGTSQDITERKKAEFALQQSDKRFRTVTRATHDLVYDLDLEKRTAWFNEAIYDEYGYDKADTKEDLDWWSSHIHPDDIPRVHRQTGEIMAGSQQAWQIEHRFRKADGSYVTVRNRAFVLRGSDGTPERIIGSLLDITAQKQLERAKDEFLSLVSHQLRTPLTVTRLYSEMLLEGVAEKLSPGQEGYVARINDASVRMIKLVGNILNISRIELDRVRVLPVETDMNVLIGAQVNEMSLIAKEKGVSLHYTPKKLPPVAIDNDIFNLILENLVMNAVRYTLPGEGKVKVSFAKNNKGYLLTVSDNGIGIPAQAHQYIFSRFYRAGNAVKFDSEGTGLGLYLIKLICEVIGAEVWFESTAGKGTRFYVQFGPHGMEPKRGELPLE